MKRITVALWALLLTSVLFSCKKSDDSPKPVVEIPLPIGESTSVGTPDDQAISQKTIGVSGGTITSTDGRIKLTFPAGALSSDQQVSIQSISNLNPLSIGQAYRLAPHNISFSKPVTIEFSYDEEDIKNTIPEALGIAYQDAQGIWQAQGSTIIDKAAKKVRVNTTHFSDWTLFESIHVSLSRKVVPVNGTVDLEVYTTDELFNLLQLKKDVPMGKKIAMNAAYVKGWELGGAGSLKGNGATAVYKAPSKLPAANPVAVSVILDLKQGDKFYIVKTIQIIEDDGEIEVRLANGPWIKKTASPAVKLGEGYYAIGDSDGDIQGSYVLITWKGEKGLHNFKSPETPTGTHVHYLITGVNDYVCYYKDAEDNLKASGGGVTITSMGEEDGFITGTFSIAPAGYGFNLEKTMNVEGKFRVRKSW